MGKVEENYAKQWDEALQRTEEKYAKPWEKAWRRKSRENYAKEAMKAVHGKSRCKLCQAMG